MTDIAIELKNVTYSYPLTSKPAVRDMNLQFLKGGFYGITGANGAGKTTLCHLIRGFIPAFYKGELQGQVLVEGKPTAGYAEGELALRIGYVFQNPFNQISGVRDTVFEEIAFGLENFGVPADEIKDRVHTVMRLTKIEELAEKNPFTLSGGQQQRAALASIIVLEPDILVLDEPTSQLDPWGTQGVFEIIAGMKEKQKTIIMAEHKTDLLAEYADEIIVLQGGSVAKSGKVQDVFSDFTLREKGAGLPQAAMLAGGLAEKGVPVPYIPITEAQCEKMLRSLLITNDKNPRRDTDLEFPEVS